MGTVAQFNFWTHALPPPALMALSRGVNGIGAADVNWETYSASCRGNAQMLDTLSVYNPGRLKITSQTLNIF